jgi:hypothetical protein
MSTIKYLIPSEEELLWESSVSKIVILLYKIEFFVGWILLGSLIVILGLILPLFNQITFLVYFFFCMFPLLLLIF